MWYINGVPSDSILAILFVCNTLTVIGCIILLAAMCKAEKKCRKEKKKLKKSEVN